MPAIICSACGARNPDAEAGGQCHSCDRRFGSLSRAVQAAMFSSFTLAALWVGFGLLTQLELSFFAIFFGALVSLATVKYSHGCGPLYQLIATTATALGIVIADVALTLHLLGGYDLGFVLSMNLWQWIDAVEHAILWDGATWAFSILGIMGGFYIWRPA